MRILIVDDSAVARTVLSRILGAEEDLDVSVAPDAIIAQRKVERDPPDLILLDLEMPRMNGLEFLRWLMERRPLPVIVLSAIAPSGSAAAMEALDLGALGIVPKPRLAVADYLESTRRELLETIRGASGARLDRRIAPPSERKSQKSDGRIAVIAMGASTGGPDAIRVVLDSLDRDTPPVLVVQHMPSPFTRYFASRLDDRISLRVREASEDERLERGHVYIAPGDRHMELKGGRITLADSAPVSRHKPSIDVLFRSVARESGGAAIGVLLTGMGEDGASGMEAIRATGGTTIVQDEATSVVFGMAAQAVRRRAVDFVEPIGAIGGRIRDVCSSPDRLLSR